MQINMDSRLSANPIDLRIPRSRFTMPKEILDTFNSGELVPFYCWDALPGDTMEMPINVLCRMTTPIAPVMDTAYLDVYFFFCPKRLVYDHWVNIRGEDSNTYWETPTQYECPIITAPDGGWNVGTVADHFGLRPGKKFWVNALPFRAYAKIWNEWFRSESITQPVSINTGEGDVVGENATWSDYVTKGTLGGECLRVSRYHDIFSSALLQPQAGEPVVVPFSGYAPVYPMTNIDNTNIISSKATSMKLGYATPYLGPQIPEEDFYTYSTVQPSGAHGLLLRSGTQTGRVGNVGFESGTATEATASPSSGLSPINLGADLGTSNGIGISINSLRNAFVAQQVMESLNRGGNRYVEILESMFGVTSPDSRLQRTEFLGARRIPISMSEVNQTSSTDATSPLGTPGANSKTFYSDDGYVFQKSFVEDGYVIGVMCVRPVHTYSQGIAKHWRKRSMFDFMYPNMIGLGDRPVNEYELFVDDDSVLNDDGESRNNDVFGYQQAWYEYIVDINETRGYMRPEVNQSLAVWNYADKYDEAPVLSTEWLVEDGSNIARTLAVQNQPQFKIDMYLEPTVVRPLPINMAPGLTRL